MSAPSVRSPLLSARNVKVHLRVHGSFVVKAVDGVDLDIHPGECARELVGKSGSGKSTLGRAMTRLLPNVELAELSGSVGFCGDDVLAMASEAMRARCAAIAALMVFQDPLSYLNPTLRIDRQLAEALRHLPERRAVVPKNPKICCARSGSTIPRASFGFTRTSCRRRAPARDDRDGAGARSADAGCR